MTIVTKIIFSHTITVILFKGLLYTKLECKTLQLNGRKHKYGQVHMIKAIMMMITMRVTVTIMIMVEAEENMDLAPHQRIAIHTCRTRFQS